MAPISPANANRTGNVRGTGTWESSLYLAVGEREDSIGLNSLRRPCEYGQMPKGRKSKSVPAVHTDRLVRVEAQHAVLCCPPEQLVWACSRYSGSPIELGPPELIPIGEIRLGHYLLAPRLPRGPCQTTISLLPFITQGTDSLGRHTFGNHARKKIPITPRTMQCIGAYVAEGDAASGVRFSLGPSEERFAVEIQSGLGQCGYSARVYPTRTRQPVRTGAVVLGRFLEATSGKRAANKRIPDFVLRHPTRWVRECFLSGLAEGDAHLATFRNQQQKRWHLGVASPALAFDVLLLLAQDGRGGSLTARVLGERAIGEHTLGPSASYDASWNPRPDATFERVLHGRTVVSRNCRWRPELPFGVWYPVTAAAGERAPHRGRPSDSGADALRGRQVLTATVMARLAGGLPWVAHGGVVDPVGAGSVWLARATLTARVCLGR